MNIYLVNDCFQWTASIYHYGSKAIIDSLKHRLTAMGHTITAICKRPDGPIEEEIKKCDAVVVNGEGTFRDEKKNWEPGRIDRLLKGMQLAKNMDKKVYLINTVWCQMSDHSDILKRLDGVSVRELSSFKEMKKIGITPEIHIDESYFSILTDEVGDYKDKMVVGEIYKRNTTDSITKDNFNYPKLSLLNHSWSYVVNSLRKARIYITGQHHGVYAACKAKCLFVPVRVNTHKITGLFQWAKVNIPIATNIKEIQAGIKWAQQNPREYQKLFSWMEKQQAWTLKY